MGRDGRGRRVRDATVRNTVTRFAGVMRRNRRGGRILASVGGYFFTLLFFGIGAFLLWDQHFGTPARMTVESCWDHGADTVDWSPNCSARPSGAPDQKATDIFFGQSGDVGHDIDVHGVGPVVVKDRWYTPFVFFGFGALPLLPRFNTVRAFVLGRRGPPRADGTEASDRSSETWSGPGR
jgi:hypothetical protein